MIFLHVANGAQKGASIQLEEGKSYTVSSDINSGDIFISTGGDEYSFAFTVNDLGVIFTHIDGKIVETNNNDIKKDKLYLFDCAINVSNVSLIFSPNRITQEYDDLEIADIDQEEQQILDKDFSLGSKFMVTLSLTFSLLRDKFYLLKSKLGKAFYPVFIVFCALLMAVVLLFYFISVEKHQESLEYQKIKIVNSKKTIENILINLSQDIYHSISVSYQGNNVIIKGVLPDVASLSNLKASLSKIKHVHIIYKITLLPQIEKIALNSCKNNNILNPKITFDQKFSLDVFISGIAKSGDDINNLQIELHNQFPDLEQIDTSRIFVENDIENYWEGILMPMKNQVIVNYDFNNGVVYLNGILAKENIIILNNAVSNFNQKYLNLVKAVASVTDVVDTLSFGVKEVFIGENSAWIVTNDGHVLFEGGTYKGITLVKITPDDLIFRSKFDFSIPIDELTNSFNDDNSIKGK